jgi:hypothetical protein
MKRVVKIGGISLDNPLFWVESFEIKNVKAVSFETLGGGKIVYESVKRGSANNLTLESRDTGWIKEETLENLINLIDYLGVEVDVEFSDGGIKKARFRLEEKAIEYEPLYDGSKWYKVTIRMAFV